MMNGACLSIPFQHIVIWLLSEFFFKVFVIFAVGFKMLTAGYLAVRIQVRQLQCRVFAKLK